MIKKNRFEKNSFLTPVGPEYSCNLRKIDMAKAFSAGGNVKDMASRSGCFAGNVPEVEGRYRSGIQRMPLTLHGAELPVIAVVNGPAIGAGCDLACMCDIRIASKRAVFGESFINLSIIPGNEGAWFVQRLIGYQRAAGIVLTG